MEKEKAINNGIKIEEMWEGLGGNFDNIQQIIFEFIDNSISNLTGINSKYLQNKQVNIIFKVNDDNDILIQIEDTGTGINNLDNALSIGNKKSQESPLNEHGFGLKHALAAADKENKNWKIYTRTKEDLENNSFEVINAPYQTENWTAKIINIQDSNWPGNYNDTGTIIEFKIDKVLLSTLTEGIPGANYNTSYERMIDYFIEDTAFTYSKIIEDNKCKINVKLFVNNSLRKDENVTALLPNWEEIFKENSEICDLGNGNVKINYIFGSIKSGDNIRYYKRNMSSSGVEIRINGRALAYNLFSEIWNKAKHNSYNYFLGIIDVISEDKNKLPETKTSKNSFKTNDSKYDALIRWIKQKYPTIKEVEESNDEYNEVKMFQNLQSNLKAYNNSNDTITTEQYVFEEDMKLRIDLYHCSNNEITIYEGKKIKTSPKDVYQLRMYWDGLVYEKMKPSKGVLLANNHPDSVYRMVEYINKMKDANGDNYNFILKTWEELNVPEE